MDGGGSRLLGVSPALALALLPAFGDVGEGLEAPVQLIYLLTLLSFLVVGAYLVVRQVHFETDSDGDESGNAFHWTALRMMDDCLVSMLPF